MKVLVVSLFLAVWISFTNDTFLLILDLWPVQSNNTNNSSTSSTNSNPIHAKISSPYNMVHVTHVGFNSQTGEFTGMPREWQILLQQSGITKKEQHVD